MAETADTTDILEAVEKDQHEILCPGQARQIERASLEIREYEKIVLWHTAKSQILSTTLTNEFLQSKGWVCLNDVYKSGRVRY